MRKIFLALFLTSLFIFNASIADAAAMKITGLQLGAAPSSNFYVAAPDSATVGSLPFNAKGVGNGNMNSTDTAAGTTLITGVAQQGDATLFGDTGTTGFGAMFLMDLSGNPTGTGLTNATGTAGFFASNTSPFSQAAVDLNNGGDTAVPSGTSVTVTIDMGGQLPHFIFVQGGATTVTYTSTGNGTLVIVSSTVGITNEANETINSTFGFFILTDSLMDLTTQLGSSTTPLLFTAWSNIWVGDMDFAFPGMSAARATSGLDGSFGSGFGSTDSVLGGSFFGLSGNTANASFWVRTDALNAMFGTSFASACSLQFKGATVSTTRTSKNMTVDGANLAGTTFAGTFTFASGGNGGLAQTLAPSTDIPTLSEWGFLIMITLLLGFGIYRMKRRTA